MDADVLLMVRVPTQDVIAIHSDRIENELVEDLCLLRKKANRIISNSLKKVLGDWCKECNTECEFNKYHKTNYSPRGSFEGYEEVLKNTNIVIAKLLNILEETLKQFQ